MSQTGLPLMTRRGIRRWVPLIAGMLAGGCTLLWTICNLQLVVTGVIISGEAETIYTDEYRLHFCGVVLEESIVLDESKGIGIEEGNDSSSRILIQYWCLLILIPAVNGLLVGGLVKFLGHSLRHDRV